MASWKLTAASILAAGVLAHGPVLAFEIVFDPTNHTEALEQVRQQIAQLDELKKQLAQAEELYDSVNDFESIEDVASLLDDDQIRRHLPDNFDQYGDLLSGDLDDLGDLGNRIDSIRESNRRVGAPTDADDFYAQALEQAGAQTARDMGVGESIYDAASQRLQGLEDLRGEIDQSDNVGELMAISTRLEAEQAILQNDLMRMEGLTMVQRAEERMTMQQRNEDHRLQTQQIDETLQTWITR